MIQGIINEHLKQVNEEGDQSEIDANYVQIIWHMIMKLAGITDLDTVP